VHCAEIKKKQEQQASREADQPYSTSRGCGVCQRNTKGLGNGVCHLNLWENEEILRYIGVWLIVAMP